MKRIGKKEAIKLLNKGCCVRFYEYYTLYGGYKIVDQNNNIVGFITIDLFIKLKTVLSKPIYNFSYTDYKKSIVNIIDVK